MVKVLGIPYDANSSLLRGPALAPQRIRLMEKEGSANRFAEDGSNIEEGTDYKDLGDMIFQDLTTEQVFEKMRSNASYLIRDGSKALFFGGDHSVSFPIIDAFSEQYESLHLLHLDAHADLYENFDNNPYSHASPFARIMEKKKIKSLTQVGIRTLTTHQKKQAEKFGVKIIEMKYFNLGFISQLKSPLYLSVDLDVLDPAFAPGVSHHEPGGLATRQLIEIIQNISVSIVGADIVEYNPIRDLQNITAMVTYKLFKEIIAKMNKVA